MRDQRMAELNLATIIDYMTCPECGGIGTPRITPITDGTLWVKPTYQCDTPGCSYERGVGVNAWTLASTR